jgi:TRAP-type C4-dicarboxylate transport system permease small subunit
VTGAVVVHRLASAACKLLALIGLGLFLLLAFAIMLDGVLRAAVNQPIDLVREVSDLVAAVAASCCLPIALINRSNIVLRAFKSPRFGIMTRILDVAADTLVLIVVAAMAWQFFAFAGKTARAGDVTWLMNLPKAPFWFAVSGILSIAALVQAHVLFETLAGRLDKTRQDIRQDVQQGGAA